MSRGVLAAILREHPVGDTLALGHDGLWIFADRSLADRILADRSLANRRRRRRRLLARKISGGGSAQHGQGWCRNEYNLYRYYTTCVWRAIPLGIHSCVLPDI